MSLSIIGAAALCLVAAALEGILAGRGVRERLADLRQPRYSPPFAVWVGIGVAYYVIAAVVLTRVLDAPASRLRWTALLLITVLLLMNALWNLAFFRLKHLAAAVAIAVMYVPVALWLLFLLMRLDTIGASVFVVYVIYLGYAVWWTLTVRRLNSI